MVALAFLFLILPMGVLLLEAFSVQDGVGADHFQAILTRPDFGQVVKNSLSLSLVSAGIATLFAFICAFTCHFTTIPEHFKKGICLLGLLPMLLPTITYGFAIMYSFGNQGLFTQILGHPLFDIYGVRGLVFGYVIYTFPIAFLLLYNTMTYIDKKFLLVSRVMGDHPVKRVTVAVLRPLASTLVISFIQCFFLSFTDYGIPASLGGEIQTLAGLLYEQMLGSLPDFHRGAAVALVMMIPSVFSIYFVHRLEKSNIRHGKTNPVELGKSGIRDWSFGLLSLTIIISLLSVFLVIFILPFIQGWPYDLGLTLDHISGILTDNSLSQVYRNSLFVAGLTALGGTLLAFFAALITARGSLHKGPKQVIDTLGQITNTIPGMVLGIAYMLAFSGTSLQTTFAILIICNVVHFFATPYMMMKNALLKMNASWEHTAAVLGDSWLKTLVRIIMPNARTTILEVAAYYFVNAMVTISGVVFLTGAKTMLMTTKIKELQHFAKFNEIFVLSFLILGTNLVVKGGLKVTADFLNRRKVKSGVHIDTKQEFIHKEIVN